jgi:hypothetical protein
MISPGIFSRRILSLKHGLRAGDGPNRDMYLGGKRQFLQDGPDLRRMLESKSSVAIPHC